MTSRFLSRRNLLACAAMAITGSMAGEASPEDGTLKAVPARSQIVANPYGHDADAFKAGKKLYARYCTECHGVDRQGGPAPGLRSQSVQRATAGDLFFVLTNGDLRSGMPSWSRLPRERRWQIVTFLKSE